MFLMRKIIKTPTLQTDRLLLRPLRLEDADALQKHFNNWNIVKNLNENIPWPQPEDGCYQFYRNEALPRVAEGKAHLWTIFYNEQAIGLLEIVVPGSRNTLGDRGFWLAEPYWGKGLMTEAIAAVNDFIFDELKFVSITVHNYKDNIGSHRVKEKTGSVLLKTTKEMWRGDHRDGEVWKLTAENWRRFRGR